MSRPPNFLELVQRLHPTPALGLPPPGNEPCSSRIIKAKMLRERVWAPVGGVYAEPGLTAMLAMPAGDWAPQGM